MKNKQPIKLDLEKVEKWMKLLLRRAEVVGIEGEVPVSAVILNEQGRCIGYGHNTRNRKSDPLGHAEINALKQACLVKDDWRFNECTLIVTLEPCQMCAGALIQARMGQVFFGARDYKRGGLGGSIDLANHRSAHHHMKVKGGILEENSKKILESWFKNKRIGNKVF